MNEAVEKIANAVLYEGYMLYPYRPSSVKNRQRWTFGGLYPEGYTGESASLQVEAPVEGAIGTTIDIKVRFLHLLARQDASGAFEEAMEREVVLQGVRLEELVASKAERRFRFERAEISDDRVVRRQEPVEGLIEVSIEGLRADLYKLHIRVSNTAQLREGLGRDQALLRCLASTHVVLNVSGGQFVSLTDPPEQFKQAAAACSNVGVWPVLAGEEGSLDCLLASPIILYDYPQIAPESAGDLFDGCEIDEILTLRIMTLTEAEKEEMRNADERTRRLLERTETLSEEEMMRLHGALRSPHVGTGR